MNDIKLPKLKKTFSKKNSSNNSSKKRKILLMSDDLRMHSGVATVSKDIILETLYKYDWVQIGAAIKHPDTGKIIDMCEAIIAESGVSDGYLKLYPTDGYGNEHMLREIIQIEKPDAILHFTDPRFWIWFYQMEHEIRQTTPIFYYNIWDDLPDPLYNANFYRSSDLLMSISKQTYGINKRILSKYGYDKWQTKYIPHGVSSKKFYKVKEDDKKFKDFKSNFGLDKFKFKVLYLNRNIRRKCPGDVALAYKHMMDKLTPEQRRECCLVFHAAPVDDNGTDMPTLCKILLPEYPVIFTYTANNGQPFNDEQINYLYNSCDVYINIASNEGFGLGSLEALTVGTPIVVNVTGGLQDQCGFTKEDGSYLTEDDYVELGSNHRGEYKEHGEWVKPVFPSNISLQGSPMTPYIFDDRVSYEDAGEALLEWYNKSPVEIQSASKKGIEYINSKNIGMTSLIMGSKFIESMDTAFEKWTPRERYTLEVV